MKTLREMMDLIEAAQQGVAEDQLDETTPEAIAKIDNLTRK